MRTSPKDWFGVGARLIGLWLLIIAFADLRAAFYAIVGWSHAVPPLINVVGFLAQTAAGLLLLLAGDALAALLFRHSGGAGHADADKTGALSVSPGWYVDSAGSDELHYWDGCTWTAHTRPASPLSSGGSDSSST